MSITATVEAGKIVLPSGTRVRGETIAAQKIARVGSTSAKLSVRHDPFLAAVQKSSKLRPHWPKDYALNHGHYVSGEPKKP